MQLPASVISTAFNGLALASSGVTALAVALVGAGFYQSDAPGAAFIALASMVPQYFIGKLNWAHFKHAREQLQLRINEPAEFNRDVAFPAVRTIVPQVIMAGVFGLGLGQIPAEPTDEMKPAATQRQAVDAYTAPPPAAAASAESKIPLPIHSRTYGD